MSNEKAVIAELEARVIAAAIVVARQQEKQGYSGHDATAELRRALAALSAHTAKASVRQT